MIQRGWYWAGLQAPPCCTKCNSPPINGQCTNFVLFDVALQLPFESKGLNSYDVAMFVTMATVRETLTATVTYETDMIRSCYEIFQVEQPAMGRGARSAAPVITWYKTDEDTATYRLQPTTLQQNNSSTVKINNSIIKNKRITEARFQL